MDFNGPPRWDHLLAAVRGGFFWPMDEDLGRPNEERPEDNEIFIPPLLHPEDQEDEEEIDVVGLDDDVMLERGGGDADVLPWFDRPDRRGGEEREDPPDRPPSAPPQQFHPPDLGMDWRQQAPPFHVPAYLVPLAHPYPFAFPYAYPHAPPFAPPYAAPPAFPFIPPFAPPYADPDAFPFIPPFAPPYAAPPVFPFIPPFAPPYADPDAFPFIPPFAPPAFPFIPPFAPPYAAPPAFPFIPPFAPPYADHVAFPPPPPAPPAPPNRAASEELDSGIDSHSEDEDGFPGHFVFPPPPPPAPPTPPSSAFSEELDSGIDSVSEDEDGYPDHFAFPQRAPLARPETLWPATLPPYHTDSEYEDQVVPSSCGLSPSTRRSREESDDKETPAKRPRWSDGND